MTYRNDPYDPKQVALLGSGALDDAVAEAEKAFAAAASPDELAGLKVVHIGDRSPVSLARREIGALPPAAKSDAGARVNAARTAIQAAYDARRAVLAHDAAERVLAEERVDVTLPWDRHPRGARHPLTTLTGDLGDILIGAGFEIADTMDVSAPPPLALVRLGRVYGTDALDATHSPVNHRVDGLVVDQAITLAHLKGVLDHIATAMFGGPARTRWRPAYSALTSPSARLDVWFDQPGADVYDLEPRWVEWGGGGMVTPQVLAADGIDPEVYSGFAFDIDVDRTLMMRTGVRDAREIAEGDVRFSREFGMGV